MTFSKLAEDNIDGLCADVFGGVEDVLSTVDVDIADIDMDSYSDWTEQYEEQVGSIAATFSCHATASVKADDAESVHIYLVSGQGDPRGVTDVSARSDDMGAAMAVRTTSVRPEDEVLSQFLENDVLPKFEP